MCVLSSSAETSLQETGVKRTVSKFKPRCSRSQHTVTVHLHAGLQTEHPTHTGRLSAGQVKVTARTTEPPTGGVPVEFVSGSESFSNNSFRRENTSLKARKQTPMNMYIPVAQFHTVWTVLTLCSLATGDIFWQGYHIWQDTAGPPTENRSVWLTEKREFATHKDKHDRNCENTSKFSSPRWLRCRLTFIHLLDKLNKGLPSSTARLLQLGSK